MAKIRIEIELEVVDNYRSPVVELQLSKMMQNVRGLLRDGISVRRVKDCRILDNIGVL